MRTSALLQYSLPLIVGFLFLTGCDTAVEPEPPTLPTVPQERVLFFDDFDSENSGRGTDNWTNFQNWNVIEGCVDLHGNGYFDVQPGNGLYVDMDGSCLEAGTIEMKDPVRLIPGASYVVEFWLSGNQRWETSDSMDVTLGNVWGERFVLGTDDDFALYTRHVDVSDTVDVRLRFDHFGGDDQGILLDLVRISRTE